MAVEPATPGPAEPDETEGAWIAQARQLTDFVCEATFAIEPRFYIGPENGIGELDWGAVNVRLPPVELPRRFCDRVTTLEVLNREAPLIEHYRRVVALAKRHGKATSLQPFPYFRTKPAIIADGEILTEFSWNDDVGETKSVLTALMEAGAGPDRLAHCDADQGWKIRIVAKASATCWIECDAEGPPPVDGGFAADRAQLALAAMDRMQIVHTRLVEALGRDYWTYQPAPAAARTRVADGIGAVLARLSRRMLRRSH